MNNIKEIRMSRGMSASQVARELDISRQAFYNYESGKREADYETLLKLGELFDCSVEELITKRKSSQDESASTALKGEFIEGKAYITLQKHLSEWLDILMEMSDEQLQNLHDYAEFLLAKK